MRRPDVTRVAELPVDGSLSTWCLVGMVPEDDDDDGWCYRTGAVKAVRPTKVPTGGAAVLIDERWGVWPLQKRAGTPFPDTILVGRATTNDVCIVDSGISKLHARIRLVGGEVWIADASSSNGTAVNGESIGRQEVALADGDLVRFGSRVFQLLSPAHLTAVVRQLRAG
jgi:hypothetical protein